MVSRSTSNKGSSNSNLPTSSSSNSSSLDNSNSSFEDDEECFYDAIDAVESNEFYTALGNLSKIGNECSETTSDEDSDENDDSKQYFFDTTTSRHSSEMNTSHSVSQAQPLPKILINDTSEENDNHKKKTSSSKLNSVENPVESEEEDDCEDAELETPWSFWIDRSVRGTTKNEYEAGLKMIHTVNTVQTFWSVCNNIPDISRLPVRYSYHLMRNTRRPLWEDSENARGGQWKFKCKKEDTSLVWNEALLASIGEQLSDCVSPKDDIVGISVSRREKDDVIQVWNLDQNYQSQATVVSKLQELVPDVKFSVVFYKAHNLHEAFEGKKSSPRKNGQRYQNKSSETKSYNHTNHKNNDKKYKA